MADDSPSAREVVPNHEPSPVRQEDMASYLAVLAYMQCIALPPGDDLQVLGGC